MATRAPAAASLAERKFYVGMALAMIFVVLIGFAPSFYLRGLVFYPRPNPSLPPLVMLHGALFTAWMLVFFAQTALVAANRRDLHRAFGIAGFCLAVLLVPLMYVTAVGQVARANQPPMIDPLNWTAVPLFPIPAFAIALWQGWKRREQAAAHKRLMLGAALMMMDPAIGRLPIVPPSLAGFALLNFLALLTYLPLALRDRRTIGRVHWATKLTAGMFAASLVLRLVALATGWWAPIAAHLPGV